MDGSEVEGMQGGAEDREMGEKEKRTIIEDTNHKNEAQLKELI